MPANSGNGSYQGSVVSEQFGDVQAAVSVKGNRITDVSISAPMDNPRSASINQQAVPMLRSETLQVQSGQVTLISGATVTSEAYAQSLQSAIDQARKAGHNVPLGTQSWNAPSQGDPQSPSQGGQFGGNSNPYGNPYNNGEPPPGPGFGDDGHGRGQSPQGSSFYGHT
jgi:uncharacterized protein with FMN-binding domain